MLYLCADGGGTKLQMLAFDEKLHLLAHVRGPAVTSNYISPELVQSQMEDTIDRLLAGLPGRPVVDCLFLTLCGGLSPADVLRTRCTLRRVERIGEGPCGLLAGAAERTGVLTLAGTGSDCFFVRDLETVCTVGGYGPTLGDEGSGYDLGRQALCAAILADEDRGVPTLLRDYVFEDYGLHECMFELVDLVYTSPDSRKQVARATYTLGRAARAGDAEALRILREGGERLARDTDALLRRAGEPAGTAVPVTVSGGAWKIHPLLWQAYCRTLRAVRPQLQLCAPRFDPVMAGVVLTVLRREGALSPERAAELKAEYAPFVLDAFFGQEEQEGKI